jgi:TonB family protein
MSFSPERPLVSYFRFNRVVVGSVNVTMAMEVSRNGNLNKLFVVKSSGIPGYDEEALRTVRASSPFAAPPAAILSTDGVLRMTWHFTTYL